MHKEELVACLLKHDKVRLICQHGELDLEKKDGQKNLSY